MQPQEFKFNTFRATVDSANRHNGVPYYAVQLEYYNDRTYELMQFKSYYEFAQSQDLEQRLANINNQAELAMLLDEYTRRVGGGCMDEQEYGISEDNYLDLVVRILEQYSPK